MKTPCDEGLMLLGRVSVPCLPVARAWVLAATILGSSMAFIDGTVVNVAVPTLQAAFHASVVDVQWVIESYGIFLSSLILAGGALGDLFGRRRMFLIGVAIFAVASAACGLASSIHELIAARCVQGIGAALLVPGSLAIISASFDEESRGKAIGAWSGFTAITTAFGPLLGGWLIQHASWRWAFFLNLPLAIAVIAISLWRVPESRSQAAGRVDWAGTVLATAGLGGLVYGLIESAKVGWRSPQVYGTLIAGAAALISFPSVEEKVSSPMVPPALFKSRTFTGANLLTFFLYAAVGIFFFVFPLNLIQVQGYSPTATGAAALPLILLLFVLSRWSGGLVVRYGPRLPLIVGPLIACVGFLIFAIPSITASYWKTFFPGFLVLGFGMAVSVAPLTTVVMNSVDRDRAGTASGVNNAVARIASLLAVAVLGVVMVSAFRQKLDQGLANRTIPPDVRQLLDGNSIKLAALDVPANLATDLRPAVHSSIRQAFIFAFRLMMWLCAILAAVSALCAWRVIEPAADAPSP